MITSQLIDAIHQVFPNVSRNQIRLDLDTAQKLLADETGTVEKLAELSDVTTNNVWLLPSNFTGMKDIKFYDEEGNPLYVETLNYKWEIEGNKLYIYSTGSTPISGLDVDSAFMLYKAISDSIIDETSPMTILDHYRDAVESYILSKYFAKFPTSTIIQGQAVNGINLQAAKYHQDIYEKLRIKIKRLFNSREITNGETINYDTAGRFVLPRRTKETGVGAMSGVTITLPGLSTLYTRFAYFKLLSTDSGEIEPIVSYGYNTLVATKAGNTLTLASTGEFDEEFILIPNHWGANWERKSDSEIEILLPEEVWSTFSFEIYERD